MASMPLGPHHQPPQPQTQLQPQQDSNEPLKHGPRRTSEMDTDKVLSLPHTHFTAATASFVYSFVSLSICVFVCVRLLLLLRSSLIQLRASISCRNWKRSRCLCCFEVRLRSPEVLSGGIYWRGLYWLGLLVAFVLLEFSLIFLFNIFLMSCL